MPAWLISEADIQRVLDASLRILARIGCQVQDMQALDILAGAGARVVGERVFLAEDLVQKALQAVPARASLGNRHGGILELGGEGQYLSTGSDGQFLLGAGENHYRPGTLAALVDLTRVADALPAIEVLGLQLIPSDLAGNRAQLAAIAAVLANSHKPCFTEPLSLDLAVAWYEMAAIAEPELDLSATPVFVACAVTQSPLVLDAENCRKLLYFADKGIPAVTMPCPMAGASSPFTLAGTLALTAAEALLELVLVQSYRPGSPVIFGSAPAIMDMPTGTVTYAAPEHCLLCSGMARIAAHLGLPCYVPLAHPDATLLDEQCAAEKAFSLLNNLASGAHLFGGAGALGKTAIVSCEQLVIDNELCLWARRFMRGITVSEETLAEDTLAEVGPGGEFLATENTLRYLRSGEHWRAECGNRRQPEAGSFPMLGAASTRVKEILGRTAKPSESAVAVELERYVREHGPALDHRSARAH